MTVGIVTHRRRHVVNRRAHLLALMERSIYAIRTRVYRKMAQRRIFRLWEQEARHD